MTPEAFNTTYLYRLEEAGTLAPGFAEHFIQTGKVRGELSNPPVQYMGELAKFLLSEEGRSYLSEEGEKSMARGGGLARVMPLLKPLLNYHKGTEYVAKVGGEMQAWEPMAALGAMARKLLHDRDAREALAAEFRPELPYGEQQVARVLKQLADRQGVRVSDPAALAQEWAKAGSPANGGLAGTARAIIGRLREHESHRLTRGSKEPYFEEREWQERNEAAEADVRQQHSAYI